jgi:AcrR family transcriptional regulator
MILKREVADMTNGATSDSLPKKASPRSASPAETAMPDTPRTSPQDKVIDALMARLGTTPWGSVSLGEIAADADLTLSQLRALFPSKGAILGGFARRIDVEALKSFQHHPLAETSARERLCAVLQQRFQAIAPYREALRRFGEALKTDPAGALAWNRIMLTSAQWMLAAAGIPETGLAGTAKAQGLVIVLAKVTPVWLNDDTLDQSLTRDALDKELARAEKWIEGVRGVLARIPFMNRFSGLSTSSS